MTTLNRIEWIEIGVPGMTGAPGSGGTGSGHDPVTVEDSASIDLTLTGQSLTAAVKPGLYAPIVHEHVIADVEGLQAALDGKLGEAHDHDGVYAPVDHAHAVDGKLHSTTLGEGATTGPTGDDQTALGDSANASGNWGTAVGQSAQALGDDSVALGFNAVVPVSSPGSMALGIDAQVPENTPNTALIRATDVIVDRSDGQVGRTRFAVLDSGGTPRWLSVTNEGLLLVDDTTVGSEGAPGVGVPGGGMTGQVLGKASEVDHDTEWIDPPEGSGGGSTHEPVTVTDSITVDLTLTGQTLRADVKGPPGAAAAFPVANVSGLVLWQSDSQVRSTLSISNVNNTSDLAKPISNATQAALNDKADIDHDHNPAVKVNGGATLGGSSGVVYSADSTLGTISFTLLNGVVYDVDFHGWVTGEQSGGAASARVSLTLNGTGTTGPVVPWGTQAVQYQWSQVATITGTGAAMTALVRLNQFTGSVNARNWGGIVCAHPRS